MGLRHETGCTTERVEVFDGTRPGPPGPPRRVETVARTGRATGRTFARGPARLGPATPVRIGRCLDCGSEVVAATP